MVLNSSFADILEMQENTNKSRYETDDQKASIKPETQFADPAWMAQIMANMGSASWNFKQSSKYFKKNSNLSSLDNLKQKTETAATKQALSRPKRNDHSLNEAQRKAFVILCKLSELQLEADFTATELKSAYRAGLLKTHPDQGGNTESFQQVRKSYQILSDLVKTNL